MKKEPWTLRPGESLIAQTQPDNRRFYLICLLLAIPTATLTLWIALVTWISYRLKRPEWILTDQRLILVSGWLTRAAQNVSLDKVNEVNYERGFAHRVLWGTGYLSVETAATDGKHGMNMINDDDPFRPALEAQVQRRRTRAS
jgi:uncharacterized membrane protein YdbT with pleckstrin-like domain